MFSISIHAPLTGCDYFLQVAVLVSVQFQSTHPLRDATRLDNFYSCFYNISIHAPLTGCDGGVRLGYNCYLYISIHAPLTGCDCNAYGNSGQLHNFNPRTPYGMRLNLFIIHKLNIRFQSTHPLRDATLNGQLQYTIVL